MRVMFYIGSLRGGGAERQLVQLARGLADRGLTVAVTTMFSGGRYWPQVAGWEDVKLVSLFPHKSGMRPLVAWQLARAPLRLRRLVNRDQVDVLYSFLHMSNLHARLALGSAGAGHLAWGIRGSDQRLPWFRVLARSSCRRLAGPVGALVANSEVGLRYHEALGFRARRHLVIPNGIDTDRFQPAPAAGGAIRDAWAVDTQRLVGMVGRTSPVKDHETFLQAASLVAVQRSDVTFVCVGNRPGRRDQQLRQLADDLGLADRLIWAGEQTDMPAIYNACDLVVSSSLSEGFSNVLGEAMACGVRCVATDVGDSATILGRHGTLIPPRRPDALAAAIMVQLDGTGADQTAVRAHIVDSFGMEKLVERTESLLLQLAG